MAIGVDSHKETLAAAAVNELGKRLDDQVFANDPSGHRKAVDWIAGLSEHRVIGVECSGNYGAALAWLLLDRGEDVREVPPGQTFRERSRRRSAGKSDPVDAVAIARVVARDEHLPIPKRAGLMVDIRLLNQRRDQLVRARTRLANQAHRDLVMLKPGYHKVVPSLRSKRTVRAAMALLEADNSVRSELTRTRLEEILQLDDETYALGKRIAGKLEQCRTSLTRIRGVGVFVAATILGEVGDISRIRSKAAFASLAGAAPLQASSGQTKRHRMNRGGNRRLNNALHVIAKTQARIVPEARAFVGRKMQEGRSYKESLRCLQRHVANAVYRALVDDARGIFMG